ncbi:hypothetical protein QTN47_23555 [Danxiaibacter flavus]|uniref:TonB-dependent receptor n=1 Tax=Danxiaibacter flavus TaxID=3049108 RepID=A0ABV3ZN33_9BACT|nr:hypothetical protein QNM32_23560 [Chitinophagaceae bacterium DXS]
MKKFIIILLLISTSATLFAQKPRKKSSKGKAQTHTQAKKKTSSQTSQKPAAQPDVKEDNSPKNVVVTSSFKPTLKTVSKINFTAASPTPDTSRKVAPYDIPAQNLFFAYQPTPLKPLAAHIDSTIVWENKNYIKAGYGNYTTPYLEAGVSLGDGTQSVVNIHAKHVSSKGSLPFQDASKTSADVTGIFSSANNQNEWTGKLFFDNNTQYQYGFQPDSLKFQKDDLRQRFTLFGAKIGLRNKTENAYGVSYNPNIYADFFQDNHGANEQNFVLNAPIEKSIGKIVSLKLGFTADYTGYKRDTAAKINNNLFLLTPAVHFKTPGVNIVAGFNPTWDNTIFHWLPNFTADIKIKGEKFILQGGWIGYFNKTNYRTLAETNPWLAQPTFLNNVRINEQYAGFKGSAGSHFTYNARVSALKFNNQPLFVNDSITGKAFEVVNESEMKALRVHGEIGYTVEEKFSLLGGLTMTQYSNLKDNEKAWGLLPLEINGALRWHITKDLQFKSDVYFWDGARYRNAQMGAGKLDPAFDLNAGVEFAVIPKLNVWLQFNNIFNNKYERWHQYEVLGFNVLAGVVYSFGQK